MNKYDVNPKQIILSVAKEIAFKQGINKINIRSVAKTSGISIGTVYNYYSTKADLLTAVIEDFWKGALMECNFMNVGDTSFYEIIREIYNSLYSYLYKFKTNWLKQITQLNVEEKKLGRQKEKEFLSKIHTMIISLIDRDKSITKEKWENKISKEKMAEFIYDNMILMLKKDEKNIEYFIVILKKVMSN